MPQTLKLFVLWWLLPQTKRLPPLRHLAVMTSVGSLFSERATCFLETTIYRVTREYLTSLGQSSKVLGIGTGNPPMRWDTH